PLPPRLVLVLYAVIAGLAGVAPFMPPRSVPPVAGGTILPAAALPVDFVPQLPGSEVIRYVEDAPTLTVLIKNDYSKDVHLEFKTALLDYDGKPLDCTVTATPADVAVHHIEPVTLTITPKETFASRWEPRLPSRGQLKLVATEKDEPAQLSQMAVRLRDITVPQLQPPTSDQYICLGALIPAITV